MEDPAHVAYQAFAPIYDEFNAANNYEMWLGAALLPELEKLGLRGPGQMLDVGCGTGRAFAPMLRRGWSIHGTDLSPAMLERAREKHDQAVELTVADARELPALGEFDLVLAINDVANYLVGEDDLHRALVGMRANLSPTGLLLFDADTLSLLRSNFTEGDSAAMSVQGWSWTGLSAEARPGGIVEARMSGAGMEDHVHTLRHRPIAEVLAAMDAAGIECLTALGQSEGDGSIALTDPPDEERDERVIYIGRAA